MAIDFSTFTEAQHAAIDKWSPETMYFMDGWAAANEGDNPATVKSRYLTWGNNLNTKPIYGGKNSKLEYIKDIYNSTAALYKEGALSAAADWLDLNNPNILDANGKPFTPGFYKDIISGDATTQKTNTATLDAARKNIATAYVDKTLNAKGTLDTKTIASFIDEIINGTAAKPYNPTNLATATSAVRGTAAYTPGTKTFDQLKATYGGLLNSSGKPVFSDNDLKAVANAKSLGAVSAFNTKLNSLADSVLKSQGSSYVTADPAEIQASRQALFKDPTTFVTSVNGLNKTNKTNLGTPSTLTGGAGIDTLTPVKSLKTWKAPQQGVATANSPYSGLLDATLAKVTGANFGTPTNNAVYKNLTDPLTQGMGLDSLTKPKLIYDTASTAGITGLGDVKGTLQSLNTQVTSTPGKVVDPDIVKPLVKTPAELAAAWSANVKRIADLQATFTSKKQMEDWYAAHPEDNPNNLKDYGASATDLTWGEKDKAREAAYNKQQEAEKQAAADKIEAEKQAAAAWSANVKRINDLQATFGSKKQMEDWYAAHPEDNPNNLKNYGASATDLTWGEKDKAREAADKIAADKAAAADKIAAEKAAADKAAADKQAEVNRLAALGRNPDGGPSSLAPINPNTYGPQQVTLAPDTVVSTPGWGVLARDTVGPISSAQTVTLPTSGPQPINPSNGGPSSLGPSNNITYGPQQLTLAPDTVVTPSGINALSAQTVTLPTGRPSSATVGPISAAQNNLGPLNISNLGAVIGPQAMNSNAGGIPSLMGPFPNTGATVQQQPTVIQQPAVVTQKPAVIGDPWDNMGISQQDYYENYW